MFFFKQNLYQNDTFFYYADIIITKIIEFTFDCQFDETILRVLEVSISKELSIGISPYSKCVRARHIIVFIV